MACREGVPARHRRVIESKALRRRRAIWLRKRPWLLTRSVELAACERWGPGTLSPGNPVVAILLALAYVAPMTALYLRRDLETAMGFHVAADLVRFSVAFVAAQGLCFT